MNNNKKKKKKTPQKHTQRKYIFPRKDQPIFPPKGTVMVTTRC